MDRELFLPAHHASRFSAVAVATAATSSAAQPGATAPAPLALLPLGPGRPGPPLPASAAMAAAVDWPPSATHSSRGGTSRDALAHVPVLKEIEQRQAVTAGFLGFKRVSDFVVVVFKSVYFFLSSEGE